MQIQRIAFLVAIASTLAACGPGDQVNVAFYGEGTGSGELRVTNDADQGIVGSLDATSTAEGLLAADSEVRIDVVPSPGSHFAGFGGDCSGDKSPLTLSLTRPIRCSVRFERD